MRAFDPCNALPKRTAYQPNSPTDGIPRPTPLLRVPLRSAAWQRAKASNDADGMVACRTSASIQQRGVDPCLFWPTEGRHDAPKADPAGSGWNVFEKNWA